MDKLAGSDVKGIKVLSFFLLLLVIYSGSVFAQTRNGPGPYDWWYTLERGKVMFRQGDYGNALLAFEDARRLRRVMYERMERNLIDLLSNREVRRIGDSLDWVERYIQERRYADAAEALEELYYRIPRESLNNSATAALTALGTLKDYPEAEYWIGETYLVEGELKLAQNQFQKALTLRQLMENPGLAVELQYKIAAICRTRQEYNEMERVLQSILAGDNLWSGGGSREALRNQPAAGKIPPQAESSAAASFTRQAMTRTLENNGIERFLMLYRYGNTETVEAHKQLGYYYYASGRHSRAQEHLMFAFLVQNTIIIDEVIRHTYDFSFTTLEKLADEINRYPLLSEYAEKNDYYKVAYYLGASLYGNGKTPSAMGIWNFLAAQSRAGEWQARALGQLKSPHVERALEMP
jgi:tetratricopeptide (TPR) repeat protein